MNAPILLDTCAAIWIAEDLRIEKAAEDALDACLKARTDVFLSPVTAWELGMLVARKRYVVRLGVQSWFEQMVGRPGTRLAELTAKILIDSSLLPGTPPRDPFDRLFIATARENGFQIMTRDSKILDYAEQGHVQVIPC